MMDHKRLYISADIEGVAGVVNTDQLTPDGFEYAEARRWMTAEVNAACEAAFDAGIEEIVVSDSHGNGQNLLLDALPKAVEVVRSWPRPLGMMEGVDAGRYDGALLIGYHTGATDMAGVLAHTMHGRGIREIKLNGVTASETLISAAIAGHFRVPILLASGDDAYAAHAAELLKDVETVTTKRTLGFTSAQMRSPHAVCEEIGEKVGAVLARAGAPAPFEISRTPIEFELRCAHRKAAENLGYLPGIERVDACTVRTELDDIIDVSKMTMFLSTSGVLNG